ncbi:hypothetical protein D3C83_205950 [compost metagenome]
MSNVRFSVTLVAIVGAMAATIAGATIWLLLTDPVGAADATSRLAEGDLGPFLRAIGSVVSAALQGLVRYL